MPITKAKDVAGHTIAGTRLGKHFALLVNNLFHFCLDVLLGEWFSAISLGLFLNFFSGFPFEEVHDRPIIESVKHVVTVLTLTKEWKHCTSILHCSQCLCVLVEL